MIFEEQQRLAEENPTDPELLAQAKLLFKIKEEKDKQDGSIIIVLATDAPLHPTQLRRLAKRATVGLARVGGWASNSSGDIFLAFSTANQITVQGHTATTKNMDPWKPKAKIMDMIDDQTINALFEASADAVEEAILNAVFKAESMEGNGNRIDALNLDKVKDLMQKYL